jgi:lipopolysaccharide/colanic/teichoic acid biosynthesis glycosyltransferase
LAVRPGITCIWQISGRNDVDFEEWMAMDAEYVECWSLWMDIGILAKTVPVVLMKRGAS